MTILTGAVVAGPIVFTAFTLGVYSIWPIAGAAGVSLLFAWPIAFAISRRIKREDPNWTREPDGSIRPDPAKPEV